MLQQIVARLVLADGRADQRKADRVRHIEPEHAFLAIQMRQRIRQFGGGDALVCIQRRIRRNDRRSAVGKRIDLAHGKGFRARIALGVCGKLGGVADDVGDHVVGVARRVPARVERQDQLRLQRADPFRVPLQQFGARADGVVHGVVAVPSRRASLAEIRQPFDAHAAQYGDALMRAVGIRLRQIIDLHRKSVLARKLRKQPAEQLELVARLVEHDQHVGALARVRKRRHERIRAGVPFGNAERAVRGFQRGADGVGHLDRHDHMVSRDLVGPEPLQNAAVRVAEQHLIGIGQFIEIEEQRVRISALLECHRKLFAAVERHGRIVVSVAQMRRIGLRVVRRGVGAGQDSVFGRAGTGLHGGRQQQNDDQYQSE